jgi:inositol hexakisphosphate/diphosphoinositol-pentakisphosphate kinase
MEPTLSRTVSAESTRSWQQLMAGSSPADRKARSSEPETGGETVGRASVSLPPSGSQAIRQMPTRRPSKASDSIFDFFGQARNSYNGSAIEEVDTTPTLEGTRASLAPVNALMLPEAFRPPRHQPDVDAAENKRLSFSSLYSIGSAIFANTRGHSWSGRSSVAGSESEGTSRSANSRADMRDGD